MLPERKEKNNVKMVLKGSVGYVHIERNEN